MYKIDFKPDWDKYYKRMNRNTQEKIWKKIQQQRKNIQQRHLKLGLKFNVLEIGQYRVAIETNDKTKTKSIWFTGNHKQYERWYTSLMK